MHDWGAYARIVWSLLAIANPLGVIPFFIDLTREQSVQGRHQTARVTAATVAVVLITGGRPWPAGVSRFWHQHRLTPDRGGAFSSS
jgi:hypothetical protein